MQRGRKTRRPGGAGAASIDEGHPPSCPQPGQTSISSARSLVTRSFPHLWRAVWKSRKSLQISAVGRGAKHAVMLAARPSRQERAVTERGESTRADCGEPVGRSCRPAQGRTQHHDVPDLVRGRRRRRADRRRVRHRRAERLHARVDRGALPRPHLRRRAGRDRPRAPDRAHGRRLAARAPAERRTAAAARRSDGAAGGET